MMKVLMLGWEFPPHITGGLGIACHGLTAALVKDQDIQVNLVLPVVHGDETSAGATLISADNKKLSTITREDDDDENRKDKRVQPVVTEPNELVITKIPADLDPYRLATEEKEVAVPWNLQLPTIQQSFGSDIKYSGAWKSHTGRSKRLAGGYGPNLFDEVGRYADVVSEMALSISFDIIHAHDWMTFPAGWATSERSGKPLVVHFHATEFDRAGENGSNMVYDIERESVQRSTRIITVSQYTADLLVSKYNADKSKIRVVHNGIAAAEKSKAKTTRDRHIVGDKVVTFLGRVTYQKGPLYFVNAAEKVLQQIPDCHFVMAGSGDTLPQVIKEVARRGMSRNFHFTGFLGSKEIERVLSISSVYVMPSVSEPFGITPLEAIRAGVPVIISRQSGVSEVMPHAIKVDFWDTDAMSQAICGVLQHRSLAKTLVTGAREQITSITWEAAARKVKTLYHETVGR
jgi:glycogen synthase